MSYHSQLMKLIMINVTCSTQTSQELSSSIFQSLSVCEWVISYTRPNIHFLRYTKKTCADRAQSSTIWSGLRKNCVPWQVMWSFSVVCYHTPLFSVIFCRFTKNSAIWYHFPPFYVILCWFHRNFCHFLRDKLRSLVTLGDDDRYFEDVYVLIDVEVTA